MNQVIYVLAMYLNDKFQYYAQPAALTLENAELRTELIKKDFSNLVCKIETVEAESFTPKRK